MAKATLTINPTIRDAYSAYCGSKGLIIGVQVGKLMIMDLYKAGYDVKELIAANRRIIKGKGIELKKRPMVVPQIDGVPSVEKIKEEVEGN